LTSGNSSSIPDWFWFDVFLSPQDGNQAAAMLAFGTTEFLGFEIDVPQWINLGTLALAQVLWTVIPLAIACVSFEKRDV
jgi:ABC-type transport system involved in multi-copper enzyme maturation permease subunit